LSKGEESDHRSPEVKERTGSRENPVPKDTRIGYPSLEEKVVVVNPPFGWKGGGRGGYSISSWEEPWRDIRRKKVFCPHKV
jgi:hypothetical protein